MVIKSFNVLSIAGFIVTISKLVYFYTSLAYSTDFIGYCRTNNYQKHICFWWGNITSLINFGSNSMSLMPKKAVFKQFT
jgi:hypothetical protein